MTPPAEARDILLIGGDGYLGAAAARALLAAGRHVTTLSRGNHAQVAGAERLVADRTDARSLAAALGGRRFDLTVDLAAFDAADVEVLWRVPGASLGRCLLISTGQVYLVTEPSKPLYHERDARRPVMRQPAEGTPDLNQWTYGVGKRRAEAAFLALRRRHGVRGMVLRLPIVLGEGDPTLRLWAWIERMLDGGPVLVPDRGRRPTRFIEAADFARLVERIAGGVWARGAAYNLAGPRPVRLARFLSLVAAAAGASPRFVTAPMATLVRHGLKPRALPFSWHWSSVLDPSRARRDLGFRATAPEDYLPRVVKWHLDHPPTESHDGYAQRAAEIALVERPGLPRALRPARP